jgi:hypothetical protein
VAAEPEIPLPPPDTPSGSTSPDGAVTRGGAADTAGKVTPGPDDGSATARVPTQAADVMRAPLAPGAGSIMVEEDQDEVLAWETAAFPEEDEPDWEALEYLEYFDDAGPDDQERWPTELTGQVLPDQAADSCDYPLTATMTAEGVPAPTGTTIPADPGTAPAAPGTTVPADPGAALADPETGTAAYSAREAAGATAAARAGFAEGGAADTMAPGPVLAGLADPAWQQGLGGLTDDELTGLLRAWQRLGARATAGLLAAISEVAARRRSEALACGDWRGFEHAEDEIAVALTLTRFSASRVLALALDLDRLPLTRAALAAGLIDERRASVIAEGLIGLDDEHAAAVEASIITNAPGQTTGELRPAVRRAVIAADPAAAKRRKEEALKDARVEASSQPSGTASLAGRDLPPAEVLAADKHLTALAMAMKKAGAEGTLDQLRARAYLHLLSGQPAGTLLTPTGTAGTAAGTAGTGTPDTGTSGSGAAGSRTAGADAPGTRGTARAGTAGAGAPGLPALRGTVNLTMPLATWLGWSPSPGQVPGFGTLDADDSRTIADLLAGDPATQWCLTLTDPAGQPVAHGCAKNGPRPPEPSQPPPWPGPSPGSWPGPWPGAGSGADLGTDPRAGPRPPGDPGWIAAVTITPLQAGNCSHPRETPAYQPGRTLRHIIEIRQATCCHPGCRRPATRCDLDHTIPHHLGGRTCECGLAPLCRAHHQAKQAPGWALTQDRPGTMTWTTPSHRNYTTGPTSYPN